MSEKQITPRIGVKVGELTEEIHQTRNKVVLMEDVFYVDLESLFSAVPISSLYEAKE